MSSSLQRDPLSGVIRQNKKVVGAIQLPEEATQDFIEEFNHCYGPISLQIETPSFICISQSPLLPVGARQPRAQVRPLLSTTRLPGAD